MGKFIDSLAAPTCKVFPLGETTMRIVTFRQYEKNTLKGFLEVELPSGMLIRDISWHQRDDKEWISLPSRKFEKQDGSDGWSNLVDFVDSDTYWKFAKAVIDALREYLAQEQVSQQPPPLEDHRQEDSDDIPF